MGCRAARREGFTLIELMIVVSIIGILAAVAIPKFAELVRKSGEGQTRGQLGAIRSALSIYYSDMEGLYPRKLESLTIGAKYLSALPRAKTPGYHADTSSVEVKGGAPRDRGGWYYSDDAADDDFGTASVNCTHTDTKGTAWSSY